MSVTMEEKCSVEKSEQDCSYAEKVKLGQKQDQSTKDNNNAAMNGVCTAYFGPVATKHNSCHRAY